MDPKASKHNGEEYYKYMLVYVGDILCVAYNPMNDMDLLNNIYRHKDGVGPSERYLDANIEKVQLKDDKLV